MATLRKNSGLKVYMQSAIASPVTITAFTNADPGVATSVAHGYSDGDVILLEIDGMTELDGRLYVVYAKADDTFQLEDIDGASGVDTTNFGTFTSGTAKEVTLGTSITTAAELTSSGGDPKFLDTTTVHDLNDKQTINGTSPISYSLTMQWDPADAAQTAMIAAHETAASRGFKVQWPDGMYMMFYGSVGYAGIPGGASQGVTTSPAAIAMEGNPTYGQ